MPHRPFFGAGILTCLVVAGCGGSNPITSVNPIPTPLPTPTPAPTPTPTPAAIACASPLPPPLYSFRLSVFSDAGYKKVLDSRTMVRDATYCNGLGYPGNICVVRDENATDAVTCGNLVTGIASQTGRYGPNWYWNDEPCRGIGEGDEEPGCRQHPSNQFFVLAFGPGIYSACGDDDRVCHGVEIVSVAGTQGR
jgi:hypothetical protein